jgi:hypothetical protein
MGDGGTDQALPLERGRGIESEGRAQRRRASNMSHTDEDS